MAETTLEKKMKLKPGAHAVVLNTPDGYFAELKHDSEIAQKLSGKFDWIRVFAKNKKELASLTPKAVKALKSDAILWLSFPKGTSKFQTDLTRDKGWDILRELDLRFITLISVNEMWSRLRFIPTRKVRRDSHSSWEPRRAS